MAEVLGTIAAISQLTSQFVTLTTRLRRYIKAIRRAPEDVEAFLMDTSNFSGVLNFFISLVDQPAPPGWGKGEQRRREKRVGDIRRQCEYVCGKMKCMVDRFGELLGGNMTRIESFLKRILYLLDKPDVEALRLSIQMATVTVNAMSTLFLWEESKSKTSWRDMFLEQLRNLLPTAAKARTKLAEHQHKYGPAYEWEAPGTENPMLVVSEDIRQQIDHAIRPYSRSRPGVYNDQSSGHRRRRRRSDSPAADAADSYVPPPPPPPPPGGPGDPTSDRAAYMPLQKSDGETLTALATPTGREARGRAKEIRHDEAVHALDPTNALASPLPSNERFIRGPADDVSEISDLKRGPKSSDENKQHETDRTSLDGHTRPSRSSSLAGLYELDTSDPMRPRVGPCGRTCRHAHRELCNDSRCGKERCPFGEEEEEATGKAAGKDEPAASRRPTPPIPGNSVSGSREGMQSTSSSSSSSSSSDHDEEEEEEEEEVEQRPSPATTVEDEKDDSWVVVPWKKGPDAVPGPKKTRRRSPRAVGDGVLSWMAAPKRGAGKEARAEEEKGATNRTMEEQDQARERERERERLRLEREERHRRQSRAVTPSGSMVRDDDDDDDDDAASTADEEGPSPYVPVTPFGGPGGRRRPRRPRPGSVVA